ncbi:MAG: helix-turn-helix domain-containing protein [Bacteroidia bacterium]
MVAINIIGISIIGIFLLFILLKRKKEFSDYFLILTNLMMAGILASDIWIKQGITPANFLFQNLIVFYILPSFLTYGMLLIDDEHRWRKDWWWFYIYAVSFTIFAIIDYAILTDYTNELAAYRYEYPTIAYHFFYKTHKLFIIFALLWFWKKLKAYRSKIKDYYSFIEPLQLNWLGYFVWVYMILNAITLVGFLIFNFGWVENIDLIYLVVNSTTVLSLFYLSYYGIRQYTLAQFHQANEKKQPSSTNDEVEAMKEDNDEETTKYQSSSLSDENISQIYRELVRLFEEETIYQEPQLKIQKVAEELSVTTHHLSQVINTKANRPFYEFVNQYRVNALKEKLTDPKSRQYTILALALDCGFNSKASLNRIFKQHTGQSPSEFQKAHLIA